MDSDELPALTAQQMEFVRGLLDGKSATAAYRAAYSTENMAETTQWANASRLQRHSNIQAWLAAARRGELGSATRTLEQHIKRLDSLQQVAIDSGNVGAAVQAEHYIGKVSGHYVEQYRDVTERDPIDTLKELAKLAPEAAQALAHQFGMSMLKGPETIDVTPESVETHIPDEAIEHEWPVIAEG